MPPCLQCRDTDASGNETCSSCVKQKLDCGIPPSPQVQFQKTSPKATQKKRSAPDTSIETSRTPKKRRRALKDERYSKTHKLPLRGKPAPRLNANPFAILQSMVEERRTSFTGTVPKTATVVKKTAPVANTIDGSGAIPTQASTITASETKAAPTGTGSETTKQEATSSTTDAGEKNATKTSEVAKTHPFVAPNETSATISPTPGPKASPDVTIQESQQNYEHILKILETPPTAAEHVDQTQAIDPSWLVLPQVPERELQTSNDWLSEMLHDPQPELPAGLYFDNDTSQFLFDDECPEQPPPPPSDLDFSFDVVNCPNLTASSRSSMPEFLTMSEFDALPDCIDFDHDTFDFSALLHPPCEPHSPCSISTPQGASSSPPDHLPGPAAHRMSHQHQEDSQSPHSRQSPTTPTPSAPQQLEPLQVPPVHPSPSLYHHQAVSPLHSSSSPRTPPPPPTTPGPPVLDRIAAAARRSHTLPGTFTPSWTVERLLHLIPAQFRQRSMYDRHAILQELESHIEGETRHKAYLEMQIKRLEKTQDSPMLRISELRTQLRHGVMRTIQNMQDLQYQKGVLHSYISQS